MTRTVKTSEARKLEIIETAARLFNEKGYSNTSVEAIIKSMGVAKGTFYYHYRSKDEVLRAVVDHHLDRMVQMVQDIAADPCLSAMAKMEALLSDSHMGLDDTQDVVEHLHLPANRELHEITNIQTIQKLSPILASIVEQGNREKVFNAKRPLETMQLLLTGAHFLLDGGLFNFNEQEISERRSVLQEILEKALGAGPGSFGFMNSGGE